MHKMLAALSQWAKAALGGMRWNASRWSWTAISMGGTEYNYRRVVGSGQGNAAVMAVVKWVARTYPEAPLVVQQRARDGTLTPIVDHPLTQLLERPNAYYSGTQLWAGTLADPLLTGNAYWVKMRGGRGPAGSAGRVVELWWVPAHQVEPRWPDEGQPPFISHYEYTVDGQVYEIPPADIVHMRDGFDPANIRKGLSPLASLLREIATDDEASNFTASILRNMGVPGVVISPKEAVAATDEDLEDIKIKFGQRFGGDNRGAPLVLKGPTDVAVLSFTPEQMQLRDVRRVPEERITAIYGVAAVVVGLGAGLDRSTFANFAEAREAAYESMMIPLQRALVADLQHQLVPDFGDPQRVRLGHDYRQVRVLQDDQNKLMERSVRGYNGGVLTRGEARQMVGEEVTDRDDVFALPRTLTLTPRDAETPDPADVEPPVEEPPADEGDGEDDEDAPTPIREAAGVPAGEVKGHAPDAGIFLPGVLAEAEQWAAGLGLGALLDAEPAPTNGTAH